MAISTDSIYSHKIFTEVSPSARTVNYPLLSDRNQEVSRSYCAIDVKRGVCHRVVYFIDPEGIIRCILIYPQSVGKNTGELLRIMEALQYTAQTGFVTPADWKPGEPGIDPKWEYVGRV